ncbi:MAG: chloride channel protein [bacterium]|nr:chloride channel protein [bacterium]
MNWKNIRIGLLGWLNRFGLARDGAFYFITIFVGSLAGFVAVMFHLSIGWVHWLLFGTENLSRITLPWYILPLIPAGGALISAIFLKFVVPEARGSGIPQTKVAYFARNGRIPVRVWVGKFFIGALNIGSGSSLGREGPTVQICAGLASWIGQTFSLKLRRVQSLVPVGAAAGLAAAFNTPIAAVTFTLEELVGDLNARVLGSIVLASVSSAVVARAILGNEPVFSVPAYALENPLELLIYAVVGIVCAGVGVAFMRSLLYLRARSLKLSKWASIGVTGLGGLVVGILALWHPEILGVGYPSVNSSLTGRYDLYLLFALLILKLIATTVSYGTGSSGGIFAPTLFMGAMAGGLVAAVSQFFFPGLVTQPGGYALVGMGAAFAAIIRAPMTSVLIIFELTQDYHIILALMVANTVAFGLSKYWQPKPIYSALSEQDGVSLPDHETDHLLHEIHVLDAMVSNVTTIPSNISVAEAIEQTKDTTYTGFPVLDADGKLCGIISQYDFNQALAAGKENESVLGVATKKYILHAHPDQSLDSVMAKLGARHITRLPVVSREDPSHLLGIITAEDALEAFGRALRAAQNTPAQEAPSQTPLEQDAKA